MPTREGAGDHPVTVDLNVSIPRKAAVTIAAQRGDVNVNGRDGMSRSQTSAAM